jgi:hypothetical protein
LDKNASPEEIVEALKAAINKIKAAAEQAAADEGKGEAPPGPA